MSGDFNFDDEVNTADVQSMLGALTDLQSFKSVNGLTDADLIALGDINADGALNNADLQALLNVVKNGGGGTSPVPEPSSWLLAVFISVASVLPRRRRSVKV
jgi:hypothetical protein